MKSNTHPVNIPCPPLFLALALAMALFFNAQPAPACSACTNNAVQIKFPETAIGILKALHEHDDALNAAIGRKQLKKVPGIVLVMRLYAKELPAKASAGKRGAVSEDLEVFRKLASQLVRAAVLEDEAGVSPALKKFDALLKTFDALFNYKS